MKTQEKILLVDDEHEFLELMGKFFQRRGIGFQTARNCLEGLDWLGRDHFDVVVMDVAMPGMDGLQCMMEMKKMQPTLEVVILTGHSCLNTTIRGIKNGAFEYCLKPVDFEQLLEVILLARQKHDEAVETSKDRR